MKFIRYFFSLLFVCCTLSSYSQYYYNDIVASQQAEKQYSLLVAAHIKQVSATSYEGSRPVDNFKLAQLISPDAKTVTITSGDPSSGDAITINSYNNGRRDTNERQHHECAFADAV